MIHNRRESDSRMLALEAQQLALTSKVDENTKASVKTQNELKILYGTVRRLNDNTEGLIKVFHDAKIILGFIKWLGILAAAAGGLWLTFAKIWKDV